MKGLKGCSAVITTEQKSLQTEKQSLCGALLTAAGPREPGLISTKEWPY